MSKGGLTLLFEMSHRRHLSRIYTRVISAVSLGMIFSFQVIERVHYPRMLLCYVCAKTREAILSCIL